MRGPTLPTLFPPAAVRRACPRLDLGTKFQGFPIRLRASGSTCPSHGKVLQGGERRGPGSRRESGLWALGCKTCVFGGDFLEGPDCKRNPLWDLRMGGKAGPGPEGRHQGGRQRRARSLEHRRRPVGEGG